MRQVQWRWVLVGVAFIYGAQLLLAAAARLMGPSIEALQVHQALFLAFTMFSFMLGGFVVGLLSPGATVIEPLLAAAGAVVLDLALPPPTAATLATGSWPVIVMTGLLLALVGGWMGERLPTPADIPGAAGALLVRAAPARARAADHAGGAGCAGLAHGPRVAAGGGYVYWRLAWMA